MNPRIHVWVPGKSGALPARPRELESPDPAGLSGMWLGSLCCGAFLLSAVHLLCLERWREAENISNRISLHKEKKRGIRIGGDGGEI